MINDFNQNSGIEEQQRLQEQQMHLSNDLDVRLRTTEGLDNYWKGVADNPDFGLYDNDRIGETLAESNNEEMANDIRNQADVTSSKANMQTNEKTASLVDQLGEHFDGSRTANISAEVRNEVQEYKIAHSDAALENWSENEHLTLGTSANDETYDFVPPAISDVLEEGPDNAVGAVAAELAARGVDMDKIDEAMKVSNSFDALENLTQIAKDEGFDDISDYSKDVQVAFNPPEIKNVGMQMAQVAPAAQNDADYNQRQPAAFGMAS